MQCGAAIGLCGGRESPTTKHQSAHVRISNLTDDSTVIYDVRIVCSFAGSNCFFLNVFVTMSVGAWNGWCRRAVETRVGHTPIHRHDHRMEGRVHAMQ